jgi:hypothetical protein|tara:strand:- start:317 stop:1528 length:1212 start_codon:yes stop_codon:yes gene_type:complete
MSSGNDLQEMEVGTTQSKTAVNAKAAPADAPETSATPVATPGQAASYEDLGGPTPENSKPDDNSNALKTPGATLKQVKDVVNKGAAPADAAGSSATPVSTPGQGGKMEEVEAEGEVVAEEETAEEAVVSEEETTETTDETEVVAESEETTEEEILTGEELDSAIEEDVNALLSGDESLSEEFREKAKLVFEAALGAKAKEISAELEEQYATALAEEVAEIKVELTERVDSYLEYVSAEWLEENALSIENGLKSEITESFITGMKGLFEEHYVSMPEEKYDVLESMVQKLDEMETKLNEQIEKNISLNKQLGESTAESVFNRVCEGLAVSQKDKLQSLVENVEFESENDYYQKLVTLRESYFPRNAGTPANETEETLTEEAAPMEEVSSTMDAYVRALSTVAKK